MSCSAQSGHNWVREPMEDACELWMSFDSKPEMDEVLIEAC
jgi:hypothetical protein